MLAERFEGMEIKENHIISFSASTDDQINDFVNLINQMRDTDIDPKVGSM